MAGISVVMSAVMVKAVETENMLVGLKATIEKWREWKILE